MDDILKSAKEIIIKPNGDKSYTVISKYDSFSSNGQFYCKEVEITYPNATVELNISVFPTKNIINEKESENMDTKKPLGAKPKYIHDILRIQELTKALYEYSNYDVADMKYDSMMEWSQELFRILEQKYLETNRR